VAEQIDLGIQTRAKPPLFVFGLEAAEAVPARHGFRGGYEPLIWLFSELLAEGYRATAAVFRRRYATMDPAAVVLIGRRARLFGKFS
jgi:hypothetical protein